MFLGIDIGTSAVKAVLMDDAGAVLSTGSAPLTISRPRDAWSEQNPRDWVSAAGAASRDAISRSGRPGSDARAVSFSGQMHGSVFLAREEVAGAGTREIGAIRPALLWNDQRTGPQCAEIERAMGGRMALVRAGGNAALPGFTLPKILWLREHEPERFRQVALVLTPKDFVRLALTGDAAIDVGDASGTLLLDIETRRWRRQTFRAVGLEPSLLPRVVESGSPAGELTAWGAGVLGVPAGTPVFAGSGDNMMGAIGAAVIAPGDVLATLGTSGVIYAHADAPRRDTADPDHPGRLHTMCAATGDDRAPGGWCVTGCMLSAGGSLAWARDVLAPGTPFETLMAEAATAPPGCDGLVFLPYLTGERCPHADPGARGGWVGLTARHTRAHLLRAVVEGVAFGLGQILDLARGLGVPVARVCMGGGGSRSPLWRQVHADVFGAPVVTIEADEGPALGAAIVAAVGAGAFASLRESCGAAVRVAGVVEPSGRGGEYERVRRTYANLYPALSPLFPAS